ncbi:MAG: four helix bundle protein, partial [Cytophagales bacterium]
MFSFEKNQTYQKAKVFNLEIRYFLQKAKIDWSTRNQLQRSSMSIMLNIAEGFGRFTNPDRR